MAEPKELNIEELVPEVAEIEAPVSDLLSDIKDESATPPIEKPSVQEAELIEQIDIYLGRMFRVGELLPWKGVTFVVVGIRDGLVGLRVHSIKEKRAKAKVKNGQGRKVNRRQYESYLKKRQERAKDQDNG